MSSLAESSVIITSNDENSCFSIDRRHRSSNGLLLYAGMQMETFLIAEILKKVI